MRKTLVLSALASLALAGPGHGGFPQLQLSGGGLFGDSIDDPDGNISDLKGGGSRPQRHSWAISHVMYGFANLDWHGVRVPRTRHG